MTSMSDGGNPLLDLEWAPCLLEKGSDPATEEFVKQKWGLMPPSMFYLLHSPWLVRTEVNLSYDHGLLIHIDPHIADVIGMATSLEGACRFCYATSRFMLRIRGMSEARVRELEKTLTSAGDNPRLSAAIAFTRRMNRSDPLIRQSDKQALFDVGYSMEEVNELAYVIAFTMLANRVATLTALSPIAAEKQPDNWIIRLLGPLIARKLNKHIKRGQTTTGRLDYSGPYNYIVDAYSHSPIAAALAGSLTEMWEETVLSRRCKTLILAVVAHALGCVKTAEMSSVILEQEGIPTDTRLEILNHLRADILDETEAVLVPFARQTVWYQSTKIQREAKEVFGKLDAARFTEAIGVIAVANALCRLGAVVTDRT